MNDYESWFQKPATRHDSERIVPARQRDDQLSSRVEAELCNSNLKLLDSKGRLREKNYQHAKQ